MTSSANPSVLEYHKGTSQDHLDRFEASWRALWPGRPRKPICLLTTCSHAKPYGKSYIHMMIRERLHSLSALEFTDIVHVSSGGLVPEDCGIDYPFCAYDWNDEEATADERIAYILRAEDRLCSGWLIPHIRYIVYFEPKDDNQIVFANIKAKYPGLNLTIVPTVQQPPLPWALYPDVDDCLTTTFNLQRLSEAVKAAEHAWKHAVE